MPVTWDFRPPRIDAPLKMHAAKDFAEHAGAEILLEAAKKLVPHDSGDLEGSGIVVPSATGAAVVFSATNEDDGYDYASRQHEDTELKHSDGRTSHYLSKPMVSEQAAILAAAANVLRAAFG